ncbi:hypothetical protein ACFPRL_26910 [Pseudoclavibacter helvolus]
MLRVLLNLVALGVDDLQLVGILHQGQHELHRLALGPVDARVRRCVSRRVGDGDRVRVARIRLVCERCPAEGRLGRCRCGICNAS